MLNQPVTAAELMPLRAIDAALRAYADAAPNPFDIPETNVAADAVREMRHAFTVEARRLFGDDKADTLLDLVQNSDDDLDTCIRRALGRRTGRVLLRTTVEQGTQVVAVFDGPNADNEAYDWVNEDDPNGVRSAASCDIFPADPPAPALGAGVTPELPAQLTADGNLEMLAADLAKAISDNGYAELGFDVSDDAILVVLPEFVTGALAAQARKDAEQEG